MKQYKAVFFDWDGTAVISRKAPADAAAAAMKGLLSKGVHLIIVSGTTYNNIAGGRIHDYFTEEELKYLYLGLGRGAYNYRFDGKEPVIFVRYEGQQFLRASGQHLIHPAAALMGCIDGG